VETRHRLRRILGTARRQIIPDDGSTKIYEKPIFWAIVVATVLFILNIWLW
jgi:hypothetical protein